MCKQVLSRKCFPFKKRQSSMLKWISCIVITYKFHSVNAQKSTNLLNSISPSNIAHNTQGRSARTINHIVQRHWLNPSWEATNLTWEMPVRWKETHHHLGEHLAGSARLQLIASCTICGMHVKDPLITDCMRFWWSAVTRTFDQIVTDRLSPSNSILKLFPFSHPWRSILTSEW